MAAFTSSDEFDLERRVWMTNEYPPYDLSKALNSSMQTPFWKWILGTASVDYDLPHKVYSENANGYIHDTDSDEVYLKMTNGQISSNYGPTVSNNAADSNFNPTYNRIEIDGVLLPEFDLMLHEVYRYLETIYPDHPDERYLLTDNEFNDKILAAAEMINYEPDVKFFDKVAKTLSRTLSTDEASSEAAKIKIRNLLNNSFRRKLYGSKAGYRMFANDIFQICTIFPVATYLPIQAVDPKTMAMEKATLNNAAALNALNMSKSEYTNHYRKHNRVIDTYSELYYKKFRLVDWDGQDSSYLQQDDENTYLFGYSIPCNENRIYEFPNNDDASAVLDDVVTGSTFENTLDDKGITYITDVSNGLFETEVGGSLLNGEMMAEENTSSTKEIHYITTSHNNAIVYQKGYVYDLMPQLIDKILKDKNSPQILSSYSILNSQHFAATKVNVFNFFESLFISMKNNSADRDTLLASVAPEEYKIILNPYVKSTALLEPKNSLMYYPSEVPVKHNIKNADGDLTGEIYLDPVEMTDKLGLFDKYIGSEDASKVDETNSNSTSIVNYLYYINGFTKGSISYDLDESKRTLLKNIPSIYEDDRYGIVVNTSNGDKAVLFGNLTAKFARDGEAYYAESAKLNITWIPDTKNEQMLSAIYDDYKDIIKAKEILEETMRPYEYVGMTKEGCGDIKKLINADYSKITEYENTDGIQKSGFGKVNDEVYFKTCSDALVTITGAMSLEYALSLYKSASSFDYSDYFELFLEEELYDQTIESYKLNRAIMHEQALFGKSQDMPDEDKTEFNQSTIRPGLVVDKVIQLYGTDIEPNFGDSIYLKGNVTEYSLGNLNVLPVINNRDEVFSIGSYSDDGLTTFIPNEETCRSYKISDTNIFYWPHKEYYNSEKTPHATKTVSLVDHTDNRINFNSQVYTEIITSNKEEDKSSSDWFAGSNWINNERVSNVTIRPTTLTPVKIEGIINVENENLVSTITFESDISKEYAKTLSIGDTVYGPAIDSDNSTTYITSIGYNSVTVNTKFTQSGTYLFTFNCKLNIVAKDNTDDMSKYKSDLYNYGEYSLINPFEHGLWGSDSFPYASNAILESLPDVSFYKPYNYIIKNTNALATVSSFNEVMNKIHPKRYNGDDFIRIPSTIKFMNDLFIELNITKVIPTATRTGKSSALMSVDWLDYIENSLKDISRATDKTNVGVNLMMETDSSGYYTMSSSLSYTDPNVQLKFITMNFTGIQPMWNNNTIDSASEWTVPAYAQIGTGGSGRFSWFTSPADITYPNIWGNNVYDSDNITAEDLEVLNENNGNIRKRSTWGRDDAEDVIDTSSNSRFRSVENPLFEIPLGEYDIQTRYLPAGVTDLNRACTTIQSSFYAQTFSNLTKYMTADNTEAGDISSMPVVLNNTKFLTAEPIAYFESISNLTYKGSWEPSLDGEKQVIWPDVTLRSAGDYNIVTSEVVLNNILKEDNSDVYSRTFNDHIISIRLPSTDSDTTFKPTFMGLIGNNLSPTDDLNKKRDLKEEMIYRSYISLGYSAVGNISIETMIAAILDRLSGTDKVICWYLCDEVPSLGLKKGEVRGLAIVGETLDTFKEVRFNKCYYTATLEITKLTGISDEDYNIAIGNNIGEENISTLSGLSEGITEIKLPRKCITEGSYNFDYIIDAGITCTGYLYGTSASNEVAYTKTSDDTNEYDSIENDNFDIVTTDEVTFNATRAAIYKDDINDVFYTYTNKIKDSNGEQTFDKLKKVAIKFEEQKYFKNTMYLSGAYKVISGQNSGSSNIIETPVLRQINGITEFNTNLLGTSDRILRITPMDLRSIYNENLEPVLYSKYYNVEGMVRGIDENNNLVIGYDNTSNSPADKILFNAALKSIVPVDKSFDEESQQFVVTPYNDTYVDFDNSENSAPIIQQDSVKFTKPILSDNKLESSSKYEFKYFKNLLVLKGAINKASPTKLVPANNDNGQFEKAYEYVQRNDSIVSSLVLSGADDEGTVALSVKYNNKSVNNIKHVSYNPSEKAFICVTADNKIGLANNINLPSDKVINLSILTTPGTIDINENPINFSTGYVVNDVSYDDSKWIISIKENNKTDAYDLEFNADSIVLKKAYRNSAPKATDITQFNNQPSVSLIGESVASTNNGQITYEDAYASPADMCINGKVSDTYTFGPYNPVTSVIDNTESFYYRDPSTGDTVYCKGNQIFVKTKNYITDKNGNYTNQLTSERYWKQASIPFYVDKSKVIYDRIVNTMGTREAYYQLAAVFDNDIESYGFLSDITKYISKKSDGNYYHNDSTTPNVIDQSKVSPGSEVTFWEKFTDMFGGTDEKDRPSLKEIMEVYYPFICILKNLHIMTWNKGINNSNLGISDFIDDVKTTKVKKYFYHNGTEFVITRTQPTLTKNDYSTYREYLEGEYNTTTKKVDIKYRGFGKWISDQLTSPSTGTIDLTTYGCDFSFDDSVKKTFSSYDKTDYKWYGDYLSNLAVYGLLEDETDKVCGGHINNAVFTKDRLVLFTTEGTVVSLAKDNLYKTSTLEDPLNWEVSTLPALGYDFVEQSSSMVKTIRYGTGDKDFIQINDSYHTIHQSVYQIESTLAYDDTIILGGYIWSRKAIEDQFSKDTSGYTLNSEYTSLENFIDVSKFYFSTTPIVLYSDNNGRSFSMSTLPTDLPNFEHYNVSLTSSNTTTNATVLSSSHTNNDGVILTNAGVSNIYRDGKVFDTKMKTILADSVDARSRAVYDNITYSSGKYVLSKEQGEGLLVKGIIKEDNEIKFYLCKNDSAKTPYGYYLVSKEDANQNPTIDELSYEKATDSSLAEKSAIKTQKYPTFDLSVNKDEGNVSITAFGVLNTSDISVLQASQSEITFSGNLVPENPSGGKVEVLVAIKTVLPISVSAQLSMINELYSDEYFGNEGCLVKSVIETQNSGSADLMYNYRETLSNNELSEDTVGYKAVSEDTNKIFYKYSEVYKGEEVVYNVNYLKNAYSSPIYLCTENGTLINKVNDTITELTLGQLVDDTRFNDEGLFTKAPAPNYDSLEAANRDPSLREEDASMKTIITLNSIKSIDTSYQDEPLASKITNTDGLRFLEKGNYIAVENGAISVHRDDPNNTKIGEDISSFSIRNVNCIGKFYYKYTGSDITIAKDYYIWKNSSGVIEYDKTLGLSQNTPIQYVNSVDINTLLNISDNTALQYKNDSTCIIKNGQYIINDCNGNITVEDTEPTNAADLGEIDSLNFDKILRPNINSIQRKYVGSDFKLTKNSYIIKFDKDYTIQGNLPYNKYNDIGTLEELSSLPYNGFAKTSKDLIIEKDSYILNDDGNISITENEPIAKKTDLEEFDLNAVMSLDKNTYVQYTGDKNIYITYGDFIVNSEDKYYWLKELPKITKRFIAKDIDNFIKYATIQDALKENELVITNDGTNFLNPGDILKHDANGIYTKIPYGSTVNTYHQQEPITRFTDLRSYIRDKTNLYAQKYTMGSDSQEFSDQSVVKVSDQGVEKLMDATLPPKSVDSITSLLSLSNNDMGEYTGGKYTLPKGKYFYIEGNNIVLSSMTAYVSTKSVTLSDILKMSSNTCVKYTGQDRVLLKKDSFIIGDATGTREISSEDLYRIKGIIAISSREELKAGSYGRRYFATRPITLPYGRTVEPYREFTYISTSTSPLATITYISDSKMLSFYGNFSMLNITDYAYLTSDVIISNNDCIENTGNNIIKINAASVFKKRDLANDDISSLTDLRKAYKSELKNIYRCGKDVIVNNSDLIYCDNSGSLSTVGKTTSLNNLLQRDNGIYLYTASKTETLYKNGFVIREDNDNISIIEDTLAGVRSLDDVKAISADSLSKMDHNAYFVYTGTQVGAFAVNRFGNIFFKTAEEVELKATKKTDYKFGDKVTTNEIIQYAGDNTISIYNGYYILHNSDDTYAITKKSPLSSNGELSEFDIVNLFCTPKNTYHKYTGDDYTIIKDSYIINCGDNSSIELNFPVTGKGNVDLVTITGSSKKVFNLSTVFNTQGNFVYHCKGKVEIPSNTIFIREGETINVYDERHFASDTYINSPTTWYTKFVGQDIYIENNKVIGSESISTQSYETINGLLTGYKNSSSAKFTPSDSLGYILKPGMYICCNNNNITVTDKVPSGDYVRAKDIADSTIENVLDSIKNITYLENVVEPVYGDFTELCERLQELPDGKRLYYKGASISEDTPSVTCLNGKYYLKNFTAGPDISTFDLFAIKEMPSYSYIRYTGDDYTLRNNSYIIRTNNGTNISDAPQTSDLSEFSIKYLSSLDEDTNAYFRYNGNTIGLYDLGLSIESNISNFDDLLYAETELESLKATVAAIEGTTPLDDRFEVKPISAASVQDSPKYCYDKNLGYFPVKPIRYVSFKTRIGYNVSAPTTVYTNSGLHEIDDAESTSMPSAITSIYLQQHGYGGTRLRSEATNSWVEELPWDIDSAAFEDKHLVNKYGEIVTLCDEVGKEIISNNAEFPVSNGETLTISTEGIAEGSYRDVSLIKFGNTLETLNSIRIYKTTSSKEYIWSNRDEVSVNLLYETGNTLGQPLVSLRKVSPAKLNFVTLESANVYSSTDGETYKTDDNFKVSNGVLYYSSNNTSNNLITSIKIVSDNIEKVIKVNFKGAENYVYDEIVPVYYNYFNNAYRPIGTGIYAMGSEAGYISISDTVPASTTTIDGIAMNVPVFYIGTTKSFFTYDFGYTNNSTYSIKNLRRVSYIDDIDVTDKITCSVTEDGAIVCTYNEGTYSFDFDKTYLDEPEESNSYLSLSGNTFVVTKNSNTDIAMSVTLENGIDNVYVKGAVGPVYMRKPTYNSFKDLIKNEQFIIKTYNDLYNASTVKGGSDKLTNISFKQIETNGVVFTDKLPYDGLNDGNSHFVRIEILPQQTVPVVSTSLYNNDYDEVSISDIELFPPDRVYFNPKGYPASPVTINNTIFNSDNNIYYSSDLFMNNNNKFIRECDEKGRFIKYTVTNGVLKSQLLSTVYNDTIDDAFIPNTPNYKSCKDWFEGEFYIKGSESNPFWQVINLTSTFNNITQAWTQKLSLNKYEKVGRVIKQVEVPEDEAYLSLSRASYAEIIDGTLRQHYNCDYLDLFEGKIRFIATEPTADMYDSTSSVSQIIKYGICANNTVKDTFHPNEDEEINLPGYLQSSYTVNSRKNYANPNEKDSAIVEVTELGIFNKEHVLIAYAVFPPIEYRSDTQHVSFTSFIKYGNCSVDESEE